MPTSTGSTDAPRRPLPQFPEPDTEPWWRATAEHRLLYKTDTSGSVVFYPRVVGPDASAPDTEWHESAGLGTVYTYTVVHQHGHPFFRSRLPYAVVVVDLDEGFRMMAEYTGPLEHLACDLRVAVAWEDHGDLSVPLFGPAST